MNNTTNDITMNDTIRKYSKKLQESPDTAKSLFANLKMFVTDERLMRKADSLENAIISTWLARKPMNDIEMKVFNTMLEDWRDLAKSLRGAVNYRNNPKPIIPKPPPPPPRKEIDWDEIRKRNCLGRKIESIGFNRNGDPFLR